MSGTPGGFRRALLIGTAVLGLIVAGFALALPGLLHVAGLHPEYRGASVSLPGKRALIVTTSHGVLNKPGEEDGPATGVFASELTHPYYTFLDGGMQVDVASVKGGRIPVDPGSLRYFTRSPEDERFLADPVLQDRVEHSLPIEDVDFTGYAAIFIAGGWGAAYDLGYSEVLAAKISDAYRAGTPIIGSVCHGALGLIQARDSNGKPLIAGRRMTAVSNRQIQELGIEMTPLHPETEVRKAGARYESATAFRDIFATHVVVDDERRFVTGQNQNSGLETAHTMMALVEERSK